MTLLSRRAVCIGAAGLFLGAAAHADAASEAFVSRLAMEAFALSRSAAGAEAFASFVRRAADTARITRTVLGRHAAAFNPAQRAQFETAFTLHMSQVLRRSMARMAPEAFRVTGSIDLRPGDALVVSRVRPDNGEAASMRWRVVTSAAGQRLIDIEYMGVFLALQQAQEFSAFLDREGGTPEALIAQLQSRTQMS